MSKILFANLLRIKNKLYFWLGLAFMVVMGIVQVISLYVSSGRGNSSVSIDDSMFSSLTYVIIILSIIISLFIGTEYSEGTIRNKIIIGHKRTDIYFANLITNMLISLVLYVSFFVVYLAIGLPLLGGFKTDLKEVLVMLLLVIILTFVFIAIYTMLAMIITNRAIAAVVCILTAGVVMFMGIYVDSRLNEPEMIDYYVYNVDGEESGNRQEKNPLYIDGTKREVYEFLNDFLPGSQAIRCNKMDVDNPWILMIYSVIFNILFTTIGIVIFRKMNIR